MKKLLPLLFVPLFLASCANYRSMTDANAQLNLNTSDLEISERMSASASETKILGIDFARLFTTETGNIGGPGAMPVPTIPIIGGFIGSGATESYALYNLFSKNKGWDAVFYPQFYTTSKRFLIFWRKTDTKVEARLARIK